MTDIRNHGFKTKAELDEHLADAEDAAVAAVEEAGPPRDYAVEEREAAALASLRDELAFLRARIAVLGEEARIAVAGRARAADASAHEQLGSHPWLKLAGAMTLTFLAAKALQRLPLSSAATLMLSRYQRRNSVFR